jgi:predicted hotdog family 3-hydroxylacyl-ACP dehydratase
MLLLDRIVDADETSIKCVARAHAAANYPLRINGVLYSLVLSEVGAQAAAAHASLFQMRGEHNGLLTALKNVVFATQVTPDAPKNLDVSAKQLHCDYSGAIYEFTVSGAGADIITGQAVLKMEGKQL